MILAIDASRCRSGGAVNHLIGILKHFNPTKYEIQEVHIWSYDSLLDRLNNYHWLIKHRAKALNKSILSQLIWQFYSLPKLLNEINCDILYTADASTLCRFKNQIVFSQDLLSYEPGIEKLYSISFSRIRLIFIRLIQNRAFRNALGVVFLSNYTSKLIQKSCGNLRNSKVIAHGVNENFFKLKRKEKISDPIVCTYVSNSDMYKNQWHVVKAVEILNNHYNVVLNLVGGGKGKAEYILKNQILLSDPDRKFINRYDFLSHNKLINLLNETDIFVFASSCEAFGITLLEGMAAGMTIACSNKSSIPELIEDAGEFFDPTNHLSIYNTLQNLIKDQKLRLHLSDRARKLAMKYSWQKCSNETFSYISECYDEIV